MNLSAVSCPSAQEHIGKTIQEVVPDLTPKIEQGFRQVIETGQAVHAIELVGETKADPGVAHTWLESWYPLRDLGGAVIGVNVVAQDITERKRAEAQLRESEALFRTLGEAVPDFLWMTDAEGRPIYQNPAWQRYVGFSPDDLTATGWQALHHRDDWPRLRQAWADASATGEAYRVEARLRRHDGEYRWFASRSVPLKDEAGRVSKWIGTMTDIHDLKLAEQALRDADRRKDEFLATLAHELRNPLAPIRNMLEIIKRADANGVLLEQARATMDRQLNQLILLIDDLLDVSRISRGKIELRKSRIELASVVHHAVEAARPLSEKMGHQLTVTLPAEPVYLNADPTRLAQVVGNLLNNACKFTNKGGRIALTVSIADCGARLADAKTDSQSANTLLQSAMAVIRVCDNGIGIAADQLPRVFEMFTQLDASLERSQSGLGIGLALVKSLVELHDGTVEVHSAGLGQGSEFVVQLPILPDTTTPPPPPKPSARTLAKPRRILVVDDNRDSAESLAMLLQLTGNETHTAFDGAEAVAAAAAYRPDVILMDIGLPKLNGYQAGRQIREQPWGQSMVLVAVTGWGQQEDRQKTRDAGFNAHLVKPVDPVVLSELLAELPHAGS